MLKTLQILFVVLPLLSHSGAVRGTESPLHEKDGLTVQLVTAITEITPGEPFLVGLILDTEEGYHTYWKGPGIVGVATNLEWTLPEGFGISYTPLPDDAEFCVSWNTDTAEQPEEFRANLATAAQMFWDFCGGIH